MAQVIFKRGLKANLPATGVDSETLYFTNDTGELFKGDGNLQPLLKISDVIVGALPDVAKGKTNRFYVADGKLYTFNGSAYVQLGLETDNSTLEGTGISTNKIKVKNGGITATQLASDAVTNVKIASNAVETAKIKDANVTEAKLALNAVTTTKIKDGAVTTDKIPDDAVTGPKIADGAINSLKMGNGSVKIAALNSTLLATGGQDNDKITTKGYVDDLVASSMQLQGTWNANTNSPDITLTTKVGYAWRVSVSGATNLGGITDWVDGDIAVKTATGWLKIDNTESELPSISAKNGKVLKVNSGGTDVEWADPDPQWGTF